LTDEDFEQAQVEGSKSIDVMEFVPAAEITRSTSPRPTSSAPNDGPRRNQADRRVKPSRQRVGKEGLAMARRLIESGTTSWKPERYEDTYRDDLVAAIEANRNRRRRRDGSLEHLSKEELARRARDAGIEGRSKMSKDQLVEALRAAWRCRSSARAARCCPRLSRARALGVCVRQ
jgi:non-homologous end joining protein Ku